MGTAIKTKLNDIEMLCVFVIQNSMVPTIYRFTSRVTRTAVPGGVWWVAIMISCHWCLLKLITALNIAIPKIVHVIQPFHWKCINVYMWYEVINLSTLTTHLSSVKHMYIENPTLYFYGISSIFTMNELAWGNMFSGPVLAIEKL